MPSQYNNDSIPPQSSTPPVSVPSVPFQGSTDSSYQYPTEATDPIKSYSAKIRQHPGKSLYLSVLILSCLFTLLPWVGYGDFNHNYYYLLSTNLLTILYIFAILSLISIKLIFWFRINAFKHYKKLLEYIEILSLGGAVMFVLTTVGFGNSQYGLIFSIFTVLTALGYITYVKFIK